MCLRPQKRNNNCIAVIGDGAITGGMAYEAMNHAGFLDTNMIVVLNDNQQVRVHRQSSTCVPHQRSGCDVDYTDPAYQR